MSLSPRARAALVVERLAAGASRGLGRGSGEVIGGTLALRVDPGLLGELARGREIGCVSGTNGKTTTTRLLARALEAVSNEGGANMAAGVVAALARARPGRAAALEVDELWLPRVARAVRPRVLVLLNISRDQLDRSNETRRIAGLWHALGADLGDCVAVANADDPLVVHAASGFGRRRWVAAGQNWTADAIVCPRCGDLLARPGPGWHCPGCGLCRPEPDLEVLGPGLLRQGQDTVAAPLALPGRMNTGNAGLAALAAQELGVPLALGLERMKTVNDVQGRYRQASLAGRSVRLLLAKNPAGWLELLELVEPDAGRPVVLAFNAQVADGRDPSWIWDVPLERLVGRWVGVCGDRAEDMAVRLAYAGVAHRVYPSAAAAVAAAPPGPPVELLATYTAFRALLGQVA